MIVIDIETSGVDPRKHGVLSVGAVEYENPDNQFYAECYLYDDLDYENESIAVHGFDVDVMRDESRQSPYVLIKSLIDWIGCVKDHTPAGLHIASFDLRFLEHLSRREKLAWPLGKRSVDLHALVYSHVQKYNPDLYKPINQRSNINGHFIQTYCGVNEIPRPHNALMDAKWEAECFSRLLSGQNIFADFADRPIPEYLFN